MAKKQSKQPDKPKPKRKLKSTTEKSEPEKVKIGPLDPPPPESGGGTITGDENRSS
jgi:hypothetical protein